MTLTQSPWAKPKEKQTRELIQALRFPFPLTKWPKEDTKVLMPVPSPWATTEVESEALLNPKPQEAYSIQDLLNMTDRELQELRHRIFDLSRDRLKIMPVALAPIMFHEKEGFFTSVTGIVDPYSAAADLPPIPLFNEHLAEVWRTWDILLIAVECL